MASSSDEKSAPKRSDAEMVALFQNAKNPPPCTKTLSAKVVEVCQAEQSIVMEFVAQDSFANPSGAIQGGFVAAMLDETMSICCIIASNLNVNVPTLEMKVSFLRPLFAGPATGRAKVIRLGKSVAFVEAELVNPEGVVVAKASATQAPKPLMKLS